jgi:uncharacterized Zn-binding protein involved in type VI secretion
MPANARIGDQVCCGSKNAKGSPNVFVNSIPQVRLGDICTGHGCFPPRPCISGSPNVFANSIPVHRIGDKWPPHCCPKKGCHPSTQCSGSPNVFSNG